MAGYRLACNSLTAGASPALSTSASPGRSSARAGDGEVLVSRTVRDLTAGSELRFESRGAHALKGIPEEWQLYALVQP